MVIIIGLVVLVAAVVVGVAVSQDRGNLPGQRHAARTPGTADRSGGNGRLTERSGP
jgi:hypothetical protein